VIPARFVGSRQSRPIIAMRGLISCLLLVSEGTNASAPLCSHASLLHTVLQSSLPRRLPPQLTVQSERATDTQAVPYDVLAECIKNKKKMHTTYKRGALP
jgi:hypothetical protein